MKYLKHITLIVLLSVFCLCFCGCATIGYVFVENENGSSTQYLSIVLDEQYLTEQGKYEAVRTDIAQEFADYGARLWDIYASNYAIIFGMNNPPPSTDLTYSGVWTDNEFAGEISFANDTVLNLTFGTNNEPVVWEKTEHTFTNTISTKTYTIYQNVDTMAFYNRLANKYADIWSLTDTQLVYQYVTSSSRLHSDADAVVQVDREHYVHSWLLDGSQINDPITLYYIQANTSIWYLLAFGITALIGGVYVLIVSLVGRKQQSK